MHIVVQASNLAWTHLEGYCPVLKKHIRFLDGSPFSKMVTIFHSKLQLSFRRLAVRDDLKI